MKHNTLEEIAGGNHIFVSKTLSQHIGPIAAFVYAEICKKYDQADTYGNLINHPKYGEGWLLYTIEDLRKNLGLSEFEELKAIKKLKEFDICEIKVFGTPGKRHFRIDLNKPIKFVKKQKTKQE